MVPRDDISVVEQPPAPLNDTSTKLVNDDEHPWQPLKHGDIRGPCPGLNTLASHGWIDRSGITTPSKIVKAVQEAFNGGNDLAIFFAYAGMLVDGNLLTGLMSIGSKSPATGPDPPPPAMAAGLDAHILFEGDVSMSRADAFFGDNHSFNDTVFQEFIDYSNRIGNGNFNATVAAELRLQRFKDSVATNPEFNFEMPRATTCYGECALAYRLFVDGRIQDGQLNLTVARDFFQHHRMPPCFHRHNGSYGFTELGDDVTLLKKVHNLVPGGNNGVNNYIPDTSVTSQSFCAIYTQYANVTVPALYPNPQGDLRKALKAYLDIFFESTTSLKCTQVFPYGQ